MGDKLPADDKKQLAAKFAALAEKLPAFDEEQLAELEEVPVRADASKDSWGSADVLYKSEAVDAFNMRYLLGVFDTKEEAEKAFEEWNAEYVKSREDMKAEMDQWSKQEEARLEGDTSVHVQFQGAGISRRHAKPFSRGGPAIEAWPCFPRSAKFRAAVRKQSSTISIIYPLLS